MHTCTVCLDYYDWIYCEGVTTAFSLVVTIVLYSPAGCQYWTQRLEQKDACIRRRSTVDGSNAIIIRFLVS